MLSCAFVLLISNTCQNIPNLEGHEDQKQTSLFLECTSVTEIMHNLMFSH